MKPSKMIGLAAASGLIAIALGASSASASTSTQICTAHTGLTCSSAATAVHMALKAGTIGKLLSPISVLCLSVLVES